MPGGRDPMANQQVGVDFIYAPYAIYDRSPGVERCIYGVGDPIPMEEAIKLGLVERTAEPKRARKPKRDRMRRPSEDR
jgi:enoyl-CoA hydratase/carnithine racemase